MQFENALTVAELKEVLRAMKLPTTGRKAELIARLGHAVSTASRMDSSAPEIIGTFENVESPEVVALEGAAAKGSRMNSPVPLEAGNVRSEPLLGAERASALSLPCGGRSSGSRDNRELEWTSREREPLKPEVEIVELDNELTRRNAGSHPRSTMAFPHSDYMTAVADLLGDFDGSTGSFTNWEKQVRLLKWMHQLDENSTRILISSKLKGRALTWFHSRSEHLQYTAEDLLLEIQRMYDHHPSRVALRKAFEERKWRIGESFGDYFHEKVMMASEVPIPEDEMIDYIIEGIADLRLRDQARMQNFKEKWSLLKSFENVTLCPESSMSNIDSSYNVTGTSSAAEEHSRSELQKCYNCYQTGHSSSNCTRPNVEKESSYKSGRCEHRKRKCSEGKSNSRVSTLSKEPIEKDDSVKDTTNKNSCGDKYHILHLGVLLNSGSAVNFIKARFAPNDAIEAAYNK